MHSSISTGPARNELMSMIVLSFCGLGFCTGELLVFLVNRSVTSLLTYTLADSISEGISFTFGVYV